MGPGDRVKVVTEGPETAREGEEPTAADPEDEAIDEAVEESFPASDSPSSWSGPPSDSPPR